MLAILSPAKNMRHIAYPGLIPTRPAGLTQAGRLAEILRGFAPWQLESLMRINPSLALAAFEAFAQFDPEQTGAPALLSYDGLAYKNLQAGDFSLADFAFAQERLRIASAFYGLLRPCDGIQPYRLELQCRLRVDGKSLYDFWGDTPHRMLFKNGDTVINLASEEYAKLIRRHLRPGERFIGCDFLVRKRGRLVCPPTWAKMARGQMARKIVLERLDAPEQLKDFHWDGFTFAENLSDDGRYVFVKENG